MQYAFFIETCGFFRVDKVVLYKYNNIDTIITIIVNNLGGNL